MKHIFISVGAIVLVGVVALGIWVKNNTGLGPVILPPPGDIGEVIGSSTSPIRLPTGFSLSIFAKDLEAPRVMTWDPNGNLLTSIPSAGKVVALIDADANGVSEKTVTLLEGLNKPHGIVLGKCISLGLKKIDCKLYVAETDKLSVYNYDPNNLRATNPTKLTDLPSGGNHFTRTLAWLPGSDTSKLLIAIGSTCNVCHEENPLRGSVQLFDLATGKMSEFAKGLRNSVFLTEHPTTHQIWATEMGRDLLGDDLPPDEINILSQGSPSVDSASSPQAGSGQSSAPLNFGWPNCYGKNIHDTEFDKNTYIRNPCMEPFETPSFIDLPAHSAPLGLTFVPSDSFWPTDYRGDLLVSYHGSWNRSVPTGYKVVCIRFDVNGAYQKTEDFISGWLTKDGALGRPVDLLFGKGALYISDDKAGVIYRVTYAS
jgi:glucose/arabinose dehydrogenase